MTAPWERVAPAGTTHAAEDPTTDAPTQAAGAAPATGEPATDGLARDGEAPPARDGEAPPAGDRSAEAVPAEVGALAEAVPAEVGALAGSVAALDQLAELPVAEHVARYDALHGELSDALASIDGI